jgi:hypothetical protein
MGRTQKLAALAASLLIGASAAHAATVQLVGTSVIYEYDNVTNSAALALFGAPTILGDTVRFLPPNFRAQSDDGAGVDNVSANFIFDRVYSIGGQDITGLQVVEFGDYEITNGDRVSADLLLTISNNNDFTEFDSDAASFDAAGDSGGLQTWQLSASINPLLSFGSPAKDLAVSIQNTLEAATDAFGESAWIQKKLSFVATTVESETVVPVPPAVWLFGSALGLLGWVRARMA